MENDFFLKRSKNQLIRAYAPILGVLFCFTVALLSVLHFHLGYLTFIPGDLGDARLNNYFLENVFQFLRGGSVSLWHPGFYFPFPFTIGFSDNLFGSSPVYVLFRCLGFDTETAFQFWFVFGYFINFVSAYFSLRRLSGSRLSSTFGALIFSFALPTTAHAGHAQLHYRAGIPLCFMFAAKFVETFNVKYMLFSLAFLVWQFFCGIYMGFFTSLLVIAVFVVYSVIQRIKNPSSFVQMAKDFYHTWSGLTITKKISTVGCIFVLMCLLFVLFIPYLKVSQLYSAKRSWEEISIGLPRIGSYLISDLPFFSRFTEPILAGHVLRYEHTMFIGVVPCLLLFLVTFQIKDLKVHPYFYLSFGSILFFIVTTLYIGGYSLWYLVHRLPLFSAIRVVTRIDQVVLFPIAVLIMLAVTSLQKKYRFTNYCMLVLFFPLALWEFVSTPMYKVPKSVPQSRLSEIEALVDGKKLSRDSVLFVAQRSSYIVADELDAMILAQKLGLMTINGYSGNIPPSINFDFGSNCDELSKRLKSAAKVLGEERNTEFISELKSRVVFVGFNGCRNEEF